MPYESERQTRKKRIDQKLIHLGWKIVPYQLGLDTSTFSNHAVEEYPTSSGPADYALFVEGKLLGIIEAKKLSVGAQNAMEQAKRYAKGVVHSIGSWNGFMVPFLYSTNGELVFYLDVRGEQNLNRAIADFHTPQALKELYARNDEVAFNWFLRNENKNPRLRHYQKKALLEEAIKIATEAHKGKVDKYGAPYIGHVTRVMNAGTTEDEKIVGMLHDLIEDTDWEFEDLEKEGFPSHIIEAIRCVTNTSEEENYDDFVKRTATNPLAIKIKLNDLTDNMDIRRMPEVTEKDLKRLNKYLKAYKYLKSL